MAYIQKILTDDEKLLALTHVHWFYALQGFLWFLAPIMLWAGFEIYVFLTPKLAHLPMIEATFEGRFWVFLALSIGGFFVFFLSVLHVWHTEIALTTTRVIYKRNWIAVDVRETDLEEVKAAHVETQWVGRFWGFGDVLLDCRFVENVEILCVAHSYEFIRRLNRQREGLRKDSMKVVLDTGRAEAANVMQVAPVPAAHDTEEALYHPDVHLSPLKKKRLHDRVRDSFKLTNFKVKD